jgi:hypothetical protein
MPLVRRFPWLNLSPGPVAALGEGQEPESASGEPLDADHQSRIIEVATATDQNSHLPCPWIRNVSINVRGGSARLRAIST